MAAREHGLSVAAFIKRAALGAAPQRSNAVLARIQQLARSLLEAVENERDYRLASGRWEKHLRNRTRLYTGAEIKRELGLPARASRRFDD
jgi:hypothetical protein